MRPEGPFRQRRREFLGFVAGGSFATVAGCTGGPARGTIPTPSRVGSVVSSTDTPTDPSTDISTDSVRLAPSHGDERDNFGVSVAVSDGTALVGAPRDEASTGSDTGGAYVFDRTESGWTQRAKLVAPDGDSGDKFGRSVAVENTTALIGAVGDEAKTGSTAGVAYLFERTANRWTVTDVLDPSTVDAADGFGVAVDLSGGRALVGAYGDERHEEFAGAVYVFERTGTAWTQQTTLGAADGDHLDHFGWSVALEGHTALVGAPTDEDPDGKRSGSAYVFDRRR